MLLATLNHLEERLKVFDFIDSVTSEELDDYLFITLDVNKEPTSLMNCIIVHTISNNLPPGQKFTATIKIHQSFGATMVKKLNNLKRWFPHGS